MTELRILKPETPAEIIDIIRDAGTNALAIEGNGSKRGLGRPIETEAVLKLSGLSGITMYEPDELVFTARQGRIVRQCGISKWRANQVG